MNDQLTKYDLANMMESYKSNIEFNKQLFQSQEKILSDHNKVIDKLADITKSQENMVNNFSHMVEKVSENNNMCLVNFNQAVELLGKIREKNDTHDKETLKQSSKLKVHLIAIYMSIGGVIVTLATAFLKG